MAPVRHCLPATSQSLYIFSWNCASRSIQHHNLFITSKQILTFPASLKMDPPNILDFFNFYEDRGDEELEDHIQSKTSAVETSPRTFRNRDRSNRSGRGQVEHNVLEGLPINQYRQVEVSVGPDTSEKQQQDDYSSILGPELPMPRDSHLLPEHSQQILRAARRGQVRKPPPPPEEDLENLDDEDQHKEVQQGFTIKKYVKVPRQLEAPEPEYLAKRRKGLPSQYAPNGLAVQAAPLRETKIKTLDAEGNVNVYKALVPEGQTIEGEVQATDVAAVEAAPATAVPGTVVGGVGVVNAEGVVVVNDTVQQTPARRRPPPPKKKRHGPGRGHKKVVAFAENATDQATSSAGSELLAVPDLKRDGESVGPSDGDTPMADAGDEEEGEAESEDEEADGSKHSPTPAKSASPPRNSADAVADPPVKEESIPPPNAALASSADVAAAASLPETTTEPPAPLSLETETEKRSTPVQNGRDPSSSPELPLSAMAHSRQNSMTQVPTLPGLQSPVTAVPVLARASIPVAVSEAIPESFVQSVGSGAPITSDLPDAPPNDTVPPIVPESIPLPVPEVPQEPIPSAAPPLQPVPTTEEAPASDGEPDLLGSLEAHLDQEGRSMARS